MQELEWKTSCGCAKCRPALNYYLVADWPDEYADDYQSRFINERVHANIQKDGTYSVVPRMWGGMTIVEGAARHRRRRRQVRDPGGQGHRRPAHRHAGHQEGGPAGGLGRSRQGRLRLRPCLCQGPAHGEDLRRLGLVPLRHAGFDRARHPHREVHVGLVDAGQGQDGGVGLPAQLRRGDLQGCRRGLRRLRLRDPFRRRRRPRHQGHRGARPGQDRGRGARGDRGADADVPRAGALSRAHLQMGQARRHRRDQAPGPRRCRAGARPISTASSSARNSPRSIRGRSASPARTSTNSGRWRRSGSPQAAE